MHVGFCVSIMSTNYGRRCKKIWKISKRTRMKESKIFLYKLSAKIINYNLWPFIPCFYSQLNGGIDAQNLQLQALIFFIGILTDQNIRILGIWTRSFCWINQNKRSVHFRKNKLGLSCAKLRASLDLFGFDQILANSN